MTEPTAVHSTFVIERVLASPPERVWAAWSDPAIKRRWFVGPYNRDSSNHALDFRIGGEETVSAGPPDGAVFSYRAVYRDIVEHRRIVTTYEMYMDDVRLSVSVATIELAPDGDGTRLTLTEQGTFLDGHDHPAEREDGTRGLLDNLAAALAHQSA